MGVKECQHDKGKKMEIKTVGRPDREPFKITDFREYVSVKQDRNQSCLPRNILLLVGTQVVQFRRGSWKVDKTPN